MRASRVAAGGRARTARPALDRHRTIAARRGRDCGPPMYSRFPRTHPFAEHDDGFESAGAGMRVSCPSRPLRHAGTRQRAVSFRSALGTLTGAVCDFREVDKRLDQSVRYVVLEGFQWFLCQGGAIAVTSTAASCAGMRSHRAEVRCPGGGRERVVTRRGAPRGRERHGCAPAVPWPLPLRLRPPQPLSLRSIAVWTRNDETHGVAMEFLATEPAHPHPEDMPRSAMISSALIGRCGTPVAFSTSGLSCAASTQVREQMLPPARFRQRAQGRRPRPASARTASSPSPRSVVRARRRDRRVDCDSS